VTTVETTPEQYIEARIEVPRQHADAVCNYVIDNITNGLVLEDEDDSPMTAILFYVPQEKATSYREPLDVYLRAVFESGLTSVPEVRERTIKNVEWTEEYRKSIQPVRIAGDIVIRPPWHPLPPDTAYDILIEPKMAFGTGTHETTRSCLTVIRNRFRPGMRFLDLGTGSGILSILASKMGASFIKSVDYDLAAVNNCKENLEINGVTTPHDVQFGSIDKCERDQVYDFVCANIIKSTILPIIPRLLHLTKQGGFLVLSGLLAQDEEEISSALLTNHESEFEILPDNKWLTFTVFKS
jgi:ribosomal protein L11 methyltransferase